MNWSEYIQINVERNRLRKKEILEKNRDITSSVSSTVKFGKALYLTEQYIQLEGYLANTFGLRRYLKNNLFENPDFLSDSDISELNQLYQAIIANPNFYLPNYLNVFDGVTGNPFSEQQIIDKFLELLDLEFDTSMPIHLLNDYNVDEIASIWENYLSDEQKKFIKILPTESQKEGVLRYSEGYKFYLGYLKLANDQKNELIEYWINTCLSEYKKALRITNSLTSDALDELDILDDICGKLELLSGYEFDFSCHYYLLHEKYLRLLGIKIGEAQAIKRDRLQIQQWNNYFKSLLLPSLLEDETFIKSTLTLIKNLPINEYWIEKELFREYLEEVQIPKPSFD